MVGTARPDASEDELASMMVGRTVKLKVDKAAAAPGAPVLTVRDLSVFDDRGHEAVAGTSLEVRAGEVLAVAGVQGNGQTELVEAIMGLRPVAGGTVELSGAGLAGRSTKDILRAGVSYIPEDRSVDGLVRDFTVAENLILDQYDQPPFASGLALRPAAIAQAARDRVAEFDVRTPSPQAAVGTLSGGNQQKVIVARELARQVKLLVAAQPTRGVDVGSTEFIHARVVKERDGADSLPYASELAALGLNLLQQKKWTDADAVLRECLAIREKTQPDDWSTFNTQSMLGGALLGQKKYADAEPLLVKGYEGMKQRAEKMPPQAKDLRLGEALERLVQLYDAWGNTDQANEWRKKLEVHRQAEKKGSK